MSEDEFVQSDTRDRLLERARGTEAIAEIAPAIAASRNPVYLVGGAVRDLLSGRPVVDVDLAVEGDPQELSSALGATATGETRFGTLSVTRGGHRYDVARTRSERYPHPGALPEVQPAGIDQDLTRRDFTVNAMALGLAGPRTGELLAVPDALDDLKAGRLAVLHERSFSDDPTRMLRLARYAARLGFEPTPHTRELVAEAIAGRALDTVSGTRVGNELRLLAAEVDPVAAFEVARELGLPWRIDAPVALTALAILPTDARVDLLVLACVLPPERLDDLGFTAADRDAIAEGSRAPQLARRLRAARSRAEIARAVGTAGAETVALAAAHGSRAQSLTWLRDLRHLRLIIGGEDLIRAGIPEGPRIGRALQAARDALMNGEALDRDAQLSVALRAAQ